MNMPSQVSVTQLSMVKQKQKIALRVTIAIAQIREDIYFKVLTMVLRASILIVHLRYLCVRLSLMVNS